MYRALLLVLLVLPCVSPCIADEETKKPPAATDGEPRPLEKAEREKALARADALMLEIERMFRVNQYREAVPLALEVLEIRKKTNAPVTPEAARGFLMLSAAVRVAGQNDVAIGLLEQALPVLERTHGPEHVLVARCLARMVYELRLADRFSDLRPFADRAETILARPDLPESRDAAAARLSLGRALGFLGHYDVARKLIERAVSFHERDAASDAHDRADSLSSLGTVLYYLRQFDAALAIEQRVLEVWEKLLGPEHPAVGVALNNVAINAGKMGRHDLAVEYKRRAIAIAEKAWGPEHWHVATGFANLAESLGALGRHEEAERHLRRALEIRRKVFGPTNIHTLYNLHLLAGVLRRQGRYDEARTLIEPALPLAEKQVGPDHDHLAYGIDNYARILAGLGEYKAAVAASERSVGIFERRMRRDFLVLQGNERLARAAGFRSAGLLDTRLAVAAQAGRTGYDVVLRFKGFVARAEAAERRLMRRGGATAATRIEELRAAERELGRIATMRPKGGTLQEVRAARAALAGKRAKAAAKRERIAGELAEDLAPLREGMQRLDLDLTDVQAHLAADAVLVDLLPVRNRLIAWIVRPKRDVVRIDLGDLEPIEDAADAFANLTKEARGLDDPKWLGAGRELRKLLFAPLERHLGEGVRALIIAPDGVLATVPFAALPGTAKGRFLVDDYALRLVSMAQDLVPWAGEASAGAGALLVGHVDYDRAAATPEEVGLTPPAPDAASLPRAPRGLSFAPLLQTRLEVEYVRDRLGASAAVLLGPNVTEARVRTEARGKRIVHLATHGFVDRDRGRSRKPGENRKWLGSRAERQLAMGTDPMLLAGLALAGANPRKGGHGDDGILTALEASRLDLDGVQLVVLSACKTALGRVESGEGVIGLVQGFQMAGAKHVLASLWNVDDQATRLLMQRLYDGVLRKEKPLSPSQALREAAVWLRDEARTSGRSFSAPGLWAAFVAYGP